MTITLPPIAGSSLKNFKIGLGLNWHSGRAYTKPLNTQDNSNSAIEYQNPNSSRLSDYFRADLSAIYKFQLSKGTKAEAGASVWNMLNQNNIVNRYYTLDTDNNIVEVDNSFLKFTPNLSFRVNF